MTKPIYFLDSNAIIEIFGKGTPDIANGQKALQELSQKFDLRTTSTAVLEISDSKVPDGKVIPEAIVKPYFTKIYPTPDFDAIRELGGSPAKDVGERSIVSVINPTYADKTITKSYYDKSLDLVSNKQSIQLISAENLGETIKSAANGNITHTGKMLETALIDDVLSPQTFDVIRTKNNGFIGNYALNPPEKIIADTLAKTGREATVDANNKLVIDGVVKDVEKVIKSGRPEASNILDTAKTEGRELSKAELSRLSELSIKGAKIANLVGEGIVHGLNVLDIALAIAEAKTKAEAGNHDAAARGLAEDLGGIIGGTALGGAGAALGVAIVAASGVGLLAGLAIVAGLSVSYYLAGNTAGEAATKNLIEAAEKFGLIPSGFFAKLGEDYHWALDNPDAFTLKGILKGLLPDSIASVGNLFRDVPVGDPLILDLNGDGVTVSKLGFGAGASTTYFDMDNDGFAERTAWVTGGDGILSLDRNGNGKIDNIGELFGNTNNVADGFSNLKTLDSNNDNKITAADANFSKLRVWIDANGDGKTDVGELKTLAELKITQINLSATTLTGVTNNENIVAATSSFVMDGTTKTINEIWFRNDTMDTRYQSGVDLDLRTLLLPTLKGFGNLKDLHVAMSQDTTLLTMVQNLVNNWSIQKFKDPIALDNSIKAILFKWAGVDTVVDGSRGNYADAKTLTFLENLTGSAYVSSSTQGFTHPMTSLQAASVANAFEIAFDSLKAQLLVQAGAGSLFTTTPTYNLATGELSTAVLSTTSINALKTQALSLTSTARDAYWKSVTEFILNVKDKAALTSPEIDVLNAAIVASGTGQTWESISTTVLSQYLANYRATELSDNVVGSQGNDTLNGLGGDDTINGRTGNDNLNGGSGNDTYKFAIGDGQDTVYDSAGTDVILMGTGITASNIRFEKSGYDLNIYYGTSDKIILQNQYYDDLYNSNSIDEIETLKFSDGTTINLKGGLTFTGTTLSESISGSFFADTLVGLAGDDNLYGYAGNDTLNGGSGKDYMDGGTGDDVYKFVIGDGQDTVYDSAGTDVILMGAGITASNIRFEKSGYDLNIYYGTSDKIILQNQYYDDLYNSNSIDEIETLKFSDGTTINLKGGLTFTGTTLSESISGSFFADTLVGLAGDDSMYGLSGDDILRGGVGNDYMDGGDGKDTASYSDAAAAVTVNLSLSSAQNTIGAGTDTLVNIENIIGSAYNDILTGDGNANTIEGGLGNDVLNGGLGIDTLSYATSTTAITVNLATTTAQNTVGAGTDTITSFENILGSSYNDTLTGDGNANTIEGGLGNDIMNGGAGIDTISYASATSAVTVNLSLTTAQNTVGAGTDTLSNFENIFASAYNDTLTGNSAANTINGGAGNDLIVGGLGADILTGGLGADIFKFSPSGLDSNFDRITDFSSSQGDKIDVKDLLVGYDAVTKAITDFVEFTTVGSSTVIKVDRDGAGTAYGWQQMAQLDNITGLTDEAALKASGNLIVA